MNPFKWAKKQVEKFLGREPVVPSATPEAPSKETKSKFDELMAAAKKRRERNAAHVAARGWKWFWVSTREVSFVDKKTGETKTGIQTHTYDVGRNKEKRRLRGGLSGKAYRRRVSVAQERRNAA